MKSIQKPFENEESTAQIVDSSNVACITLLRPLTSARNPHMYVEMVAPAKYISNIRITFFYEYRTTNGTYRRNRLHSVAPCPWWLILNRILPPAIQNLIQLSARNGQ